MTNGPRWLFQLMAVAAILAAAGCEIRSEPAAVGEEMPLLENGAPAAASQAEAAPVRRGGIEFVAGYRGGYDRAVSAHKPMLVFFTAEWCTYCHQMEADAFTQEAVVNLSQEFVCVLVDADAEPDVCRDFRVKGYPTIQFLSPRGVPLNRITGKQPGKLLIVQMQAALQAVAHRNQYGDSLQR